MYDLTKGRIHYIFGKIWIIFLMFNHPAKVWVPGVFSSSNMSYVTHVTIHWIPNQDHKNESQLMKYHCFDIRMVWYVKHNMHEYTRKQSSSSFSSQLIGIQGEMW